MHNIWPQTFPVVIPSNYHVGPGGSIIGPSRHGLTLAQIWTGPGG